MVWIKNKWFPFGRYAAVYLFGLIFYKGVLSERTMRHESIHNEQYKEVTWLFLPVLLVLGFISSWWWLAVIPFPYYVLYIMDYLIGLVAYGGDTHRAYRGVLFEMEAHENHHQVGYLEDRKEYAWIKYVKN